MTTRTEEYRGELQTVRPAREVDHFRDPAKKPAAPPRRDPVSWIAPLLRNIETFIRGAPRRSDPELQAALAKAADLRRQADELERSLERLGYTRETGYCRDAGQRAPLSAMDDPQSCWSGGECPGQCPFSMPGR